MSFYSFAVIPSRPMLPHVVVTEQMQCTWSKLRCVVSIKHMLDLKDLVGEKYKLSHR